MKVRNRVKSLRMVKASELLPSPANWRTHPQAQQDALRGVLAEIGYAGALIARETTQGLQLLDGHLRAETTPDAKVPVLVVDLTDEEADKLLATLDPIGGMAGTDGAKLAALVAGIETDSVAVAAMLAKLCKDSPDAPRGILEDVAPEPPKKPVTKPGDLWILGDHRLRCGDATDAKQAAAALGGRKPFIMVTDQPYGVEYDAKWRNAAGISNSKQTGKVENDDRASWCAAFVHFPGDVAYCWHAGRHASQCERSLEVLKFEVRAQIIWMKKRIVISRGHYHWRHEPCWFAVRRGAVAKWNGGRKQSTVWADIVDSGAFRAGELYAAKVDDETVLAFDGASTTVWDIAHDKAAGGGHSTQKPVECMARPIRNHGESGDDVYDPFLGSGTTIIAAEQLGRRCVGLELSPAYCDVIVERWQAFTGKKASRRAAKAPARRKKKATSK